MSAEIREWRGAEEKYPISIFAAAEIASGEELVELAKEHIGEKYVLGTLAPKDNPRWKGPWDCAEFISWLVFQVAKLLYGCNRDAGDPSTADAFTGFWARDARALGRIVSVEEAARTPGAAVLRVPHPCAMGHVVISDGAGGTVEAHSSRAGVIASTLSGRRWDMGILVPGIQYGPRAEPVNVVGPGAEIYRLASPVMKGEEVKKLQTLLKARGFDPGDIDGEFGPHTQAAVLGFQLASGLLADGEVGPETAKGLGIEDGGGCDGARKVPRS